MSWPDGEAGKPHIDLQGVNMERLLRRGVKRENIALHDGCTYDSVNMTVNLYITVIAEAMERRDVF